MKIFIKRNIFNDKDTQYIKDILLYKVLWFKRIRGSFMWFVLNKKTNKINKIYCQFSLKDPWWIPKYDPNYLDGKLPLYGWLFFYFGYKEHSDTHSW